MDISKLSEFIGALYLLTLVLSVGGCLAASADVGGWIFAADLGDEWRISNETWSFDPHQDITFPDKASGWEGWEGVGSLPFQFPEFPNAPEDDEFYDSDSAYVRIFVLKIPEELKNDIENQNIRVYGSLDKVPDDQKEQDLKRILQTVARFIWLGESDSEKDITFEDRPTHLIERDIDYNKIRKTDGVIAVALDANTVSIIDTHGGTKMHEGGVDFEGRAWDILEKFKISQARP